MLTALETYERFIYGLPEQFPSVQYSTLIFIRLEPFTAIVKGEVFFANDIRLRVREVLDFDEGFIQRYSYEAYRGEEKLYWYDSFPHPHIPELASTDPHHKHIPPNIKRHRVPATELSFDRPNLPFLIREIAGLLFG